MTNQDWHVTQESQCIVPSQELLVEEPIVPYRLYRFLTDLEEILLKDSNNTTRLQKICPLVRHLLDNSPWIELQFLMPDPETGWSVNTLYDEPDYPLTIQMVTWAPGMKSSIHNHATWGVVAILSGEEKNTFWQAPDTFPEHISSARQEDSGAVLSPTGLQHNGDRTLGAGDIITFMPNAIHQIEALGDEPVVSFNLYGETDFEQRFKFDPDTGDAKLF